MIQAPKKIMPINNHSSEKKLKTTYKAILLIIKDTSALELERASYLSDEILDS